MAVRVKKKTVTGEEVEKALLHHVPDMAEGRLVAALLGRAASDSIQRNKSGGVQYPDARTFFSSDLARHYCDMVGLELEYVQKLAEAFWRNRDGTGAAEGQTG